MRIGYVLKKYPRLSETFILGEILELQRQGVDVTVFSLNLPDEGIFHPQVSQVRGPVIYLPDKRSRPDAALFRRKIDLLARAKDGIFAGFADLLRDGVEPWPRLHWGLRLAIEVEARSLSHLHAHFGTVATDVAALAHRVTGVPFSFTAHAKDIYRNTVDPVRFGRLAALARSVVTVCQANERHIRENLLDGGQARIETVYNGIDLDLFHPRHRDEQTPPLVLGVGRLVEKKGFHHLVAAAAGMERRGIAAQVTIVGEGDERGRLEDLIGRLSTRSVTLLGARPQDEVRTLLQRASVVALPCSVGEDGNRDALPTVLLEALASGVPAISTPVAGVPEILEGGQAGVLVPCDDAAALEGALVELLGDPDRRERMARRGRERAERLFDGRKSVARLKEMFAESRVAEGAVA